MENKVSKVEQKPTVAQLLQTQQKQIAAALPRHLTAERFARIALTEVRKNPELALCDAMSLFGAVIQCAQLGLEPGSGLGHAFLIPFNNRKKGIKEVVFITGYKGLIDLARRSGHIESISARIVKEKDTFKYTLGDDEKIIHEPSDDPDPGRITHVYAIAKFKGGMIQREVMNRAQIDAHKERFSKGNPVWDSDFDEMARKTAVRRLCKYLPLSPEDKLTQALQKDDEASAGEGQANWEALDVSYTPIPPVPDFDKAKANIADGGTPLQSQAEQDAERKIAAAELDKALAAVSARKLDPEVVLNGIVPASLAKSGTIEQIYTAVDRLMGAIK